MVLLEVFFALTVLLFIITFFFYISRVREYSSIKSQYLIPIFIISLYAIFFANFRALTLEGIGASVNTILLSALSQLILLFSVFVFVKSFFLLEDKMLLEPLSRFTSKRGIDFKV